MKNNSVYEEPTDDKGYTQLAHGSDNYQKYDELQLKSSEYYNAPTYEEPRPVSKVHQKYKDWKTKPDISDQKSTDHKKVLIVFTTVIICACALTAGLTYAVLKSRNNATYCIHSSEMKNENTGVIISEIGSQCPNDWKTFDNMCYKEFVQRRTWFKARDYCRSIGADLVSIHNDEETEFIINNLPIAHQWIGLSNFQNNGKYVWSDETIFNYSYWGPSEPNNLNNNENCTHLFEHGLRKWNDNNCYASHRFICSMQIMPRCGSGSWVYYKNSCYLVNTESNVNFTEARNICQNNSADLVIIRSKEEYNFLISRTTKQTGGDFWIGLQRFENGTYKWIDDSSPTYLSWGIGEPGTENKHCVRLSSKYGYWFIEKCGDKNWFVCEKQLL